MSEATDKSPLELLESDSAGIRRDFFIGTTTGWNILHLASPSCKTQGEAHEFSERAISSINLVRRCVEAQGEDLMRSASVAIADYLDTFKIQSKAGDPLKIAYWFGVKLHEEIRASNEEAGQMVLCLMIELLDRMAKVTWTNGMNQDMKNKFFMAIRKERLFKDFGEFGAYHSFKSLVKSKP